jgi:hypothetical protein
MWKSTLVLVLWVASGAQAASFGSRLGEYEGQGRWQGRLIGAGGLRVEATISEVRNGIQVSSRYKIAGLPMGDTYVVRHERNGFFDLYSTKGKKRGTGFCMENHCQIQMPGDKLTEAIVFDDEGCMARFGSKVHIGGLWSWSEKLCKK